MTIVSGSFQNRVVIQRRGEGKDGAGQPIGTWEDVAVVWANIKGQTGMGSITAAQDNVSASIERYSVRIRYREGLDVGMRVLHSGRPFDVKQIRMDFANKQWTDLICEQGGNDG